MRAMLTHVYHWHVSSLVTDIPCPRYLDGWGRPGDTALVAIEGGHRIGAGWFRLFHKSAPGYGFVNDRMPELTIATVPSRQGDGITQLLLAELLERARVNGHPGISVSIEYDHPDFAIYEAAGFEHVSEGDRTVTMVHTFS